jgi:hypothetical protein
MGKIRFSYIKDLQINYLPFLSGCGWRCQQNSDYQPVGLHFASLPALSSLSQKRNLISLPVLSDDSPFTGHAFILPDKQQDNYTIIYLPSNRINKKNRRLYDKNQISTIK